jgi:hypothetical protein
MSEIKFESGQADITCCVPMKEVCAVGNMSTLFERHLLSNLTNVSDF